jgi:nitroreductase
VNAGDRLSRPPTPEGFDASRAAERAADPRGWRYPAEEREAVYRVIAERRDIRRFRPDEVPADVLDRVLGAAHQAPSVGLMQPWRLIVIREVETRCVGWPDERPVRPGLESAGWSARAPLDAVVMRERWQETESGQTTEGPTAGPDRAAAIAARDRSDRLVKPAGSLGALEAMIERWASIAGEAPPSSLRAGVLVCAADHGHVRHGTSLFDAQVSSQVTAAAARGETAIGVLARRGEHDLLVADVGLLGSTPAGVRDAKVAAGSADMTAAPALGADQLDAALRAGADLAAELADRGADCLVLGEIGIGNTTTAAALSPR